MELKSIHGLVVTFIIIGIVLGVGFLVLDDLLTESYKTQSWSKDDELLTTVTETGENFAVSNYRDVKCTITEVLNTTSSTVINSGNYTQTNCNLRFKSGGMVGFNNTNWNVTYTYTFTGNTTSSMAIDEANRSLDEIPDWLDIVVIVFLAGLILFIVFKFIAPKISGGEWSFGGSGSEGVTAQI